MMKVVNFFSRQLMQIIDGGAPSLLRKIKLSFKYLLHFSLCLLVLPVLGFIYLIRPWFLVRWGILNSSRIGHFVANTEIYLCEREAGINKPSIPHVDLFYFQTPISNKQLKIMWKRILRTYPAWFMSSLDTMNRLIGVGSIHNVGKNSQHDRDVHNLLDVVPKHLEFTPEEELRGQSELRKLGISPGTEFVCLIVRDSAYLETHQKQDWSYHNYRDCDIQNYVLAAEELANRGYYVIRMGAKVHSRINSTNPKVIDYATNGMRSDFMDIYLGSKCLFCISTSTGWDTVPAWGFRRPMLITNHLPFGYLPTFSKKFVIISKHHYSVSMERELTLQEIFASGVGFGLHSETYEKKGIRVFENTPEEIRDATIEMIERLNNTWVVEGDDEDLQKSFWESFEDCLKRYHHGKPIHGKFEAHFSAHYLRKNRRWIKN